MNRIKIMVTILCVLLAGCGSINRSFVPSASILPPPSSAPAVTAEPLPAKTQEPAAEPTVEPTAEPTVEVTPTPVPEPTEINLMAVGDIMFQYFEIQSAYDRAAKSYDFNYSFQYMKDILSSADLALGNFECTLGGKPPYSQRKSLIFNAPDAAADALKIAGFDLLQTANNHANNTGSTGILRTVQVLSDRGMVCTGVRKNAEDKPYVILDVKGIKIGFTSYSWCTRLAGGNAALDYQKLDKSVKDLVNVFSNKTLDKDIKDMGRMAQQMREDGAEVVVFGMHWGAEYRRDPDSNQKKIAQGLADAGVDVVIGSHPHWLQTVDMLPNKVTGGKTIVAYSLGNFISCQRDEFKGTGYNFKYSEDCMILNLKIVKQPGGAASVSRLEYLPAWTFMYDDKGRHFTVLPLEKAIASPEAYGLRTKGTVNQAKRSFENTQKLFAGAVAKGYLSLMKTE